MSSIKKQFENEEEYFKRLEIFLKSIEKGYNPRDRYELLNECNTLIIYFDEFLEKYLKKIESAYKKRLEISHQDLSHDTGGAFDATSDLANISSAKKKSYKSDIDTSSNKRNSLDD